jgi:hypothetical protein
VEGDVCNTWVVLIFIQSLLRGGGTITVLTYLVGYPHVATMTFWVDPENSLSELAFVSDIPNTRKCDRVFGIDFYL